MSAAAVMELRAERKRVVSARASRFAAAELERDERRRQRAKERRVLLRAMSDLDGIYAVEATIVLGDETPRGVARARQRLNQLERLGKAWSEMRPSDNQSGLGQRVFRRVGAEGRS